MATTTEAQVEGEAQEGTAHEGADGGHKGVFPPLDSKTFPSQIFWLVLFFAALYLLMSKLVLPRIASILEARRNRIDGDLARATALKEETEAALHSYQKSLADARGNAGDIAKSTRDTVNADVSREQAVLDASLLAKAMDAETKISAAKTKAMASVKDIAADAAADIVTSLTGGKVTKTSITRALAAAK
jgi:F-type H+-transporting ATPase subunit b